MARRYVPIGDPDLCERYRPEAERQLNQRIALFPGEPFQKWWAVPDGRVGIGSDGQVSFIIIEAADEGPEFIFIPTSHAHTAGWGKPRTDANRPLGTPGGQHSYNGLRGKQLTRSFTIDGQDPKYGNVDWVWKRDGAFLGYLSWDGPPGRNLPPTFYTSESFNFWGDFIDNGSIVEAFFGNTLSPFQEGRGVWTASDGGTSKLTCAGHNIFLNGKVVHTAQGLVLGAGIQRVEYSGRKFDALIYVQAAFNNSADMTVRWVELKGTPKPNDPATVIYIFEWPPPTPPLTEGAPPAIIAGSNFFFNEDGSKCASVRTGTWNTPAQSNQYILGFSISRNLVATSSLQIVELGIQVNINYMLAAVDYSGNNELLMTYNSSQEANGSYRLEYIFNQNSYFITTLDRTANVEEREIEGGPSGVIKYLVGEVHNVHSITDILYFDFRRMKHMTSVTHVDETITYIAFEQIVTTRTLSKEWRINDEILYSTPVVNQELPGEWIYVHPLMVIAPSVAVSKTGDMLYSIPILNGDSADDYITFYGYVPSDPAKPVDIKALLKIADDNTMLRKIGLI